MSNRIRTLMLCLPIGWGLSMATVGCGGSDESKGNAAGASSGGSSSAGTSSSNAGSGTTNAGSGTGGTTSSSGSFSTGLPGDTQLSSLTDSEVKQLCDKIDGYYSSGAVGTELKDFSCRFAGILAAAFGNPATDAAAQAACKQAYDPCVAAPAKETATTTCNKPSTTCTATVSELEACANDTQKYLAQVSDTLPSCSDLTLADLKDMGPGGAGGTDIADPASCTTLDMKCPDSPKPPMSGMMTP